MQYAVIMAGGSGTRLWPLSRKANPKQALRLIGDRTMFQHAVDRLAPDFTPDRILVVTSAPLADVLRPQTPELPFESFIIEPEGRDSAPAAALAAAHLLRRDPDAVMVILTADHHIADTAQFRLAVRVACDLARSGSIVTLGIRPDHPATGFGYIELGQASTIEDGLKVYHSGGFREKPDLATATVFLEDGRHVWNSGMFVWRADRLMAELAARLPDLHRGMQRIIGAEPAELEPVTREVWSDVQRISIDYGIMEQAEGVMVIPVEFGWTDVGSWSALLDVLPLDDHGNALQGGALVIDSNGCLVRSEGRLVALLGVEDLVVVETPDAVLVCRRDRAQHLREIVNSLTQDGRHEYL